VSLFFKFNFGSQLRELLNKEPEKFKELLEVIKKFRDDEVEHHDIGLEHDAEKVFTQYNCALYVSLLRLPVVF
jgi:demethoxyubiquinone hydroxylase (CLK1/Coq7/Cat5 family)